MAWSFVNGAERACSAPAFWARTIEGEPLQQSAGNGYQPQPHHTLNWETELQLPAGTHAFQITFDQKGETAVRVDLDRGVAQLMERPR